MLTDYLRFDEDYNKLRSSYYDMCEKSNLSGIKDFFKEQSLSHKKLKYEELMTGIYTTIKNNDKVILDYLLLNIPIGEEELFRIMTYISRYGDGELFKVLISHHKEDVNERMDTSEILVSAVEHNNINFVEYLLTDKEIRTPDIHLNYDKALRFACIHEHIDIIKFLLTSDKIIEKADVHAKNDECLIWSFKSLKFKTVDYLLFDYKIKITEYLDVYIKNNRELVDYINRKKEYNGKI